MSYVKINEDLFVIEQSVKNDNVIEKRTPVNHIWVYDRSGSMYGVLRELTDQLIGLSKQLPIGDTLTIGWFSSEGERNFMLKGFKISDESDYDILEKTIRNNSTTVGLTCFSEIITDTKEIIEDLSVFSNNFSFHFFTDGYPVVSNRQKEIDDIFTAIEAIKGKITTAMLVGYGYYYNKELMTQMAEKLGAMLIHSSMVQDYSDSIVQLMDISGSTSPKQDVLPPVDEPMATFTITNSGVIVHSVEDNGFVSVAPQGERTTVYYLSSVAPGGSNAIPLENLAIDSEMMSAIYGASFVMSQQMNNDIALELLGSIGDKKMIDAITNSFTIDEYGETEKLISTAVVSEDERFINGKDTNYLPPSDAFCVLDVLNKLMDDNDASFYPYHDGFKYNKVSKPTKFVEGYSKFNANDNVQCSMDDLVWNKELLNLSVRATIDGTIQLQDKEGVTASDVGFTDEYPVFVYRNYTFIKDGVVNVKKFFVSTSQETYDYFVSNGVVVNDTRSENGIYGIELTNLPAINRDMVDGGTSATKMCSYVKKDMELSGEIKALKDFLKNEFDNASSFDNKLLSDKQKEFLIANGVDADKGGVYNPKTETVDTTDMYIAKTFQIKIKGLSSIPSVKKVVDKINNNKKRTLSESVVEVGLVKYEAFKETTDDEDMRKLWLNKEIARIKSEQKSLRKYVQQTKFAILLGGKWFDEFESRADNVLIHDDWQFTFVVGDKTVKF